MRGLALGRAALGPLGWGPWLRLEARGSLLVVGPTQAGKTASIVVPALLDWDGPAVVTSVKSDVVQVTRAWRERLGRVQVLEPGREHGLSWDPLEAVDGLRSALRAASELTSRASAHADSEFWNALASKLVGALFVLVRERGGGIRDVVAAVESRDLEVLARGGGQAGRMLEDFLAHEARTLDGVLTTAETMLLPWRLDQPLARVRDVLEGPNTLFLVGPRGQQRSYEGLFRGALASVLEAQQLRVESGRGHPLLLVLDEAALVAPLEDLDEMAASLAGLGVTLLSVVQDFAQLHARWGPRAATIVNNHTSRLVLGGLADPQVSTFLPEALGPGATSLRRLGRGRGVLVCGSAPVRRLRLVPWWRRHRLRRRGQRALATMPR